MELSAMTSSRIDAVIFDLGGVIADFRPDERLARFTHVTGFTPDEVKARLFNSGFDAACDRGEYSLEEAYSAGIGLLEHRITQEEYSDCWCSAFSLNEPVLDVVEQVSCPRGLLTNNGPILLDALRSRFPRLLDTFDPVVFSCQTGATKPDLRPYQYAARELDTMTECLLFIDDSSRNVEGAIQAGMQALRFTGLEALETDLKRLGLL
jgi:glucose-1-phosphatase